MLRLLFLADLVLKSRGAGNLEERMDIKARWLMCHEQLREAADVRDLLVFYLRSTFCLYGQGRLELEPERPRDSVAEGLMVLSPAQWRLWEERRVALHNPPAKPHHC